MKLELPEIISRYLAKQVVERIFMLYRIGVFEGDCLNGYTVEQVMEFISPSLDGEDG
ncbi:MAG: hypothetical protein JRJ45_07850 [Deltaproteobacteria bacterium]|nr:hypothetical protein [Deltaproteobacteria bacterium]